MDYIASHDRMIDELIIRKDLKGSNRGSIKVKSRNLPRGT
jgi:hypothetical protein